MDFHYKIGMVEYVKNVRNSLEMIIDQLNRDINNMYGDFELVNVRRMKRLFYELKMHKEFIV